MPSDGPDEQRSLQILAYQRNLLSGDARAKGLLRGLVKWLDHASQQRLHDLGALALAADTALGALERRLVPPR
jgi:pyridoxine/pyridoxamine 5'-phosphate oxidase